MTRKTNSRINRLDLSIRSRGRLPHWEAGNAAYFVTFRLADSPPTHVLDQYLFEREDIIKTARTLGRDLSPVEIARLDELYSDRVESFLDSGHGACYLADSRIASVVKDALCYFHGVRYRLLAWCIINHVHVMFRCMENHKLADVLHSWKSFSAKKANHLLARTGAFWQREYYDRLIRDEVEYYRILRYVIENPEKAGLSKWPWVEVVSSDA